MKTTYKISMLYTSDVSVSEDCQTITEAIEYERECLELYGDERLSALEVADCESVEVFVPFVPSTNGHISDERAKDIISNEGIGYAIRQYCHSTDMINPVTAELWLNANLAIQKLENHLKI